MKGNDNLVGMKSNDITHYRIGRANQSLGDADVLAQAGSWNGTVNRLFFACFYSVAALAAQESETAESVDMRRSVDQYIRSGHIRNDHREFYGKLLALRLDGDYDYFVVFDEQKVRPVIAEVRQFVADIDAQLS